jgi:hypothetical protein
MLSCNVDQYDIRYSECVILLCLIKGTYYSLMHIVLLLATMELQITVQNITVM